MTDVDQFIGRIFDDRFKIERLLGHGGWSCVYEAHDIQLNRKVALKLLHTHLRGDNDQLARFQREAEFACKLRHPNIAQVLDYGLSSRGEPFIVMEFLEGQAFDSALAHAGRFDAARSVRLLSQVCDGLFVAHQNGIVHRDLKPGNLMLLENDQVKILDFGLAKVLTSHKPGDMKTLTETGETMGTPAYMSPEQCLGLELTAKADIYSLGCIAYELLTGETAIMGDTLFELMHRHVDLLPQPFPRELKIPQTLEQAVFVALAKRPENRYDSTLEMKRDLLRGLDGKRPVRRRNANEHSSRLALRHLPRKSMYAVAVVLFGAIVYGGISAANLAVSPPSKAADEKPANQVLALEQQLSSKPTFDYTAESALIDAYLKTNQREKALQHINVVLKNVPGDLQMVKILSEQNWGTEPGKAIDALSKTARTHGELPFVCATCDLFVGDIFAERPDAQLARKYYNFVLSRGGNELAYYRLMAQDRLNTLVKMGL